MITLVPLSMANSPMLPQRGRRKGSLKYCPPQTAQPHASTIAHPEEKALYILMPTPSSFPQLLPAQSESSPSPGLFLTSSYVSVLVYMDTHVCWGMWGCVLGMCARVYVVAIGLGRSIEHLVLHSDHMSPEQQTVSEGGQLDLWISQ